jgi:hypothetical protein
MPTPKFETLGKHHLCGGEVQLVYNEINGSRTCLACGSAGIWCRLNSEVKEELILDDVTIVAGDGYNLVFN